MSELTERERRVLSYRMRISDTDSNEVVDELPEVLNLSREKIRQIEVQAMKKLRRLAQRHKLNDLMNP